MRLGLIGCGLVGALREAAIARLPSVRLVAVSDVDRTRAATLAGRCGARIEPEIRQVDI